MRRFRAGAGAAKAASNGVESVVAAAFEAVPSEANGKGAVPAALLAKRVARARRRIEEALGERGSGAVPPALRKEVQKLVASWAERGFEDGFEEARDFELRCFQEGELAEAERVGNDAERFAAEERRYRAAVIEEFGRIEIRGLQMSARVYQSLEVAYVPLFLQEESGPEEVFRIDENIEIRRRPRRSVEEFVEKHKRGVIVGAPGSGKSTIVAYLAAKAAEREAKLMPFVVAVRSIGKGGIDEATIAACQPGCSVELVRRVFAEKRALLLVDGLDEAQSGPKALVASLEAFARAHPGNRIVVTSRPASGAEGSSVKIEGFATATLQPMNRQEVYTFIERWCRAAELSLQKDARRARADADEAAEDLKGRVERSRPIEKLAETPLICSVLCIVHRFLGQRIPERRAALYEACTNVLLYEWDRAKFPEGAAVGKLDAQEKRFLLSRLARWMHEGKRAEAAVEEVVQRFEEGLPMLGRRPKEALAIVEEIRDRSGILVERRPGFFAFSHLTFQEYLTALAFVQAGESRRLVARRKDRFWHEVIALAAGLPGADAAGIVRGLIKDDRVLLPAAGTFLAAQCLDTATDFPVTLRREVEARLSTLVPPRSDEDMRNLIRLGDVVGPVLLRALQDDAEGDPAARARAALVLGAIAYEPACRTLVRMNRDDARVLGVTAVPWGDYWIRWTSAELGFFACMALLNGCERSQLMRAALEDHLSVMHASILAILDLVIEDSKLAKMTGPVVRSVAHSLLPKIAPELHLRDLPPKPAAHSD